MEDWNKKRKRFEALWHNEIIDRCCIRVVAIKDNSYTEEPFPEDPKAQQAYWLDGETYLKRELKQIENTLYYGEAFPLIFANFGAAGHAAFFKGIKIEFRDTIWMLPDGTHSPGDKIKVAFDPESLLLKKTYEVICYLAQECRGCYFISLPDISGNLDALAHICGAENCLIGMIEQQDEIKKALKEIMKVWQTVITDTYSLTQRCNDQGSCIGWLDTWAPGLHGQLQADISVMISPDTYETLVIPELEEQCDFMEYPLYHLDGQEQIRHLDYLLGLEKLKMIQWTNVAGQPSPSYFIPVLQKIQQAGKGLLIRISDINEIETLMTQLSSKGLYINVDTPVESDQLARDVIKLVEKLTHD